MRRFSHSLAPVATVGSLGDALANSDYAVEDGELIFVETTRQVFAYRNPPVLAADGVNVVQSNFGPGRWELVATVGMGETSFAGYYNTASAGASGSGRLLDVTATFLALLTDQSKVWVKSVRDSYTWYAARTDAHDGLLVVNPTANGGNPGRFIRDEVFATTWRKTASWNVDPSGGDDENDGTALPIRTVQEIRRRTGSVFARGNRAPTISLLSDIASGSSDTFVDDFSFDDDPYDCWLTWMGVRTQIASGSITAVQQPNAAMNADRTATSVGTNWSIYAAKGVQVVMTSGSASGSGYWVMKDKGSGVARISQPAELGNIAYTPSSIAVGDYRVDRLISVGINVDLQAKTGFRKYQNLVFLGASSCATVGGAVSLFVDCSFDSAGFSGKLTTPVLTLNCQWTSTAFWGGFLNVYAGSLMLPVGAIPFEAEFGQYQITDLECQDMEFRATHGARLRVFGLFGIWDSPADGLLVGGVVEGETDSIYGTGNTGHGVKVLSLSGLSYSNKPTINAGAGAGHECLIGGTDKLWNDVPFVNTANLAAIVPTV
jgi:hypothetical protein